MGNRIFGFLVLALPILLLLGSVEIQSPEAQNPTFKTGGFGGAWPEASGKLETQNPSSSLQALQESYPKADLQALSKLETEEKVKVIVFLKDPEPISGLIEAQGLEAQAVQEKKAEYSSIQDSVISSVHSFSPKAKYKYFNGFAGEATREQLAELQRNPEVERIIYDAPVYAQLAQALPLQNVTPSYGLYVNGQNITGRGQTACVLDTGIAYDHESFGSCTADAFMDGNCSKIPGGWNFINDTNNPYDDHSHGSHVSGIIAANGSIRGVAPDSKIVALKVLNSAGSGSTSDVALAIEWCLSNKTIFNVSVISMSLGDAGSYVNATCPTTNTSIYSSAKSAGIAIFAASGNNNYSTGVSSPACDASITSVGAVYDANVGEKTWTAPNPDCIDATTAADQLACGTNRGNNLDLLATGSVITSVYYTGGNADGTGTSQAAPMASGTALLMKQFIQLQGGNATPAQIEYRLKVSGKNITDPWNGTIYPRISALQALISVDTTPPIPAFVSPTPANNITINQSYIFVNATVNENYSSALLEWNGVNETLTNSTGTLNFYAYKNKTSLETGAYSFKVYIIDLHGNVNSTETRNATIDQTPAFSFSNSTPANNSAINTSSIIVNVTFTSPAPSKVFLEWNLSANVTMNGTYPTYGANISGLGELNYTYKVHANSTGSGIWNVSGTMNARVDANTPVLSILAPTLANKTATANSSLIFNVSSSETLATATALVNGTLYNFTNRTGLIWDLNASSLQDGNYSYNISIRDFANNTNMTGNYWVFVQTADINTTFIPPTLANASNTSFNWVFINFTLSGYANNVTLEWNQTSNESVTSISNYYFANKSLSANGTYTYRILANNSGRGGFNASEPRIITVDTIAPNASFSHTALPNGTITNATSLLINITSSENLGSLILQWNGTNITINDSGTAWEHNRSGLSDGNYTYFAYIADPAGNTNITAQRNVYIDSSFPYIFSIVPWNITNESATVSINATEPVNGTLYYTTSTGDLYNTSTLNFTTPATSHNLTLTGLSQATYYHLRIRISDHAANYNSWGTNNTFATAYLARLNLTANSSVQVNATTANVSVILAASGNISEGVLNVSVSSQPSLTNLSASGTRERELPKFYNISATSNITSALSSAIIRIYYNESDLSTWGLNESTLRLFRFNSSNSSWEKYDTGRGGVDTDSNFAYANTSIFSEWAPGAKLLNGYACAANATCGSGFCNQSTLVCGPLPVDVSGSTNDNNNNGGTTGGTTGGTSGGTSGGSSGGGAPAGGGGAGGSSKLSAGISSGEKSYYFTRKNTVAAGASVTRIETLLINNDTRPLPTFELKELIPPSATNFTQDISFSIQPDRIENGSIIAVWKFSRLLPGESIQLFYNISGKIYRIVDFNSSIKLLDWIPADSTIDGPASAPLGQPVYLMAKSPEGPPLENTRIILISPLGRKNELPAGKDGIASFTAEYYGEYEYSFAGSQKIYSLRVPSPQENQESQSRPAQGAQQGPPDSQIQASQKQQSQNSIAQEDLPSGLLLAGALLPFAILLATIIFIYQAFLKKKARKK